MPVSRTNFRAGDRVRGAEWFDEIAGAVGTVVEAVEVRGHAWAAQDLLVRFDRPVIIFDEPQWTFLLYTSRRHRQRKVFVRAISMFSPRGGA